MSREFGAGCDTVYSMTANMDVRETDVMPRRPPRPGDGPDEWAAWRVAYEREHRGWSLGELARRVTEAGAPMQHQAIWQIENRQPPRRISLSEAIAFSEVFGIDLAELGASSPEDVVRAYGAEVRRRLRDWQAQARELIDLVRGGRIQPPPDAVAYQAMLAEMRDVMHSVKAAASEAIANLDADLEDTD